MSEMIDRVARAMMDVRAKLPGMDIETPVLSSDPDFDDLPRDSSEGNADDEITQEAVLKLAYAAIAAMREPTEAMIAVLRVMHHPGREEDGKRRWQAAIDEALK